MTIRFTQKQPLLNGLATKTISEELFSWLCDRDQRLSSIPNPVMSANVASKSISVRMA
jgi:hypothetical protein